jgi:huntingtin-interacting protein 1-related protein
MINEQARMLKEYEDKQAALVAQREAAERERQEQERRRQQEFEEAQRLQAERERLAQEQLLQQQMNQYNQITATRQQELEREILAMRGQYERDQLMLEQYDRVRILDLEPIDFNFNWIFNLFQRVKALEGELQTIGANVGSQMATKDELIKQLQDQVTLWRNKYEALAKLYSQLRSEHLDMLSKFKQMQLKANSAQEAIDRMERMERDVKAKNLELADMIRERDRARFDVDRLKSVRYSS